MTELDAHTALTRATHHVGLDAAKAEPIRLGENAIYRLPHGVVARVTRPGQLAAATKEVQVARWLERSGVRAVQAVAGLDQPISVKDRAVTFWHELPSHEPGTPLQVAGALRQLHALPIPTDIGLGPLAPFVRLTERIDGATTLTDDDQAWMRQHLTELEQRYAQLPAGLSPCVVHGDAWVGNVVTTEDGSVILLDLERFSVGPPEWDLVSTVIKYTSFGWISAADYTGFVQAYGHDVTDWAGFATLRDIREFRMACYAVQRATDNPATASEAARRLASLQGKYGTRPWRDWRPAL